MREIQFLKVSQNTIGLEGAMITGLDWTANKNFLKNSRNKGN